MSEKINEHDKKLIQAAAEVSHWSVDDSTDPNNLAQLELLGHNQKVFTALSDHVAGDILKTFLENVKEFKDLSDDEIARARAVLSVGFEVGVLTAEVAYKENT